MSKRLIPQAPMVEKYIGLLADSPLALSQMAEPYGEDALAASLGPKTWSAVEILAHLRGCSDVWTFSILAMLAEHEPTLAPMDPRRWAKAEWWPPASVLCWAASALGIAALTTWAVSWKNETSSSSRYATSRRSDGRR